MFWLVDLIYRAISFELEELAHRKYFSRSALSQAIKIDFQRKCLPGFNPGSTWRVRCCAIAQRGRPCMSWTPDQVRRGTLGEWRCDMASAPPVQVGRNQSPIRLGRDEPRPWRGWGKCGRAKSGMWNGPPQAVECLHPSRMPSPTWSGIPMIGRWEPGLSALFRALRSGRRIRSGAAGWGSGWREPVGA